MEFKKKRRIVKCVKIEGTSEKVGKTQKKKC